MFVKRVLALVVLLGTAPAYASIDFSYIGLGYAWDKISFENDSCNQSGILINAAIPLNEWFYVVGEHMDQTSSDWCGVTKTQAGAGTHHDISQNAVAYGEARAIFADYPWDEDVGLGLSAGVRATVVHGTEVKGFLTYESVGGENDTLVGVGVNMWMNKDFSGFLDIAFGDISEQRIQFGVRYNF